MKCMKCGKELNEETEIKSVQESSVFGGIIQTGYECGECGHSEEF